MTSVEVRLRRERDRSLVLGCRHTNAREEYSVETNRFLLAKRIAENKFFKLKDRVLS